HVTYLVVYAPSDDERVGTKQEFYEELEEILTGIGQIRENNVRGFQRENRTAVEQQSLGTTRRRP
ncbi:hypothetical protein HHI36_017346, partial [Cryptolaemus montrouzieri]